MFPEIPSRSPSSVEHGGAFCFVSLFTHMQDLVVLRKGVLNKEKKKKGKKKNSLWIFANITRDAFTKKIKAVFHRCNFKCKIIFLRILYCFFPFV